MSDYVYHPCASCAVRSRRSREVDGTSPGPAGPPAAPVPPRRAPAPAAS